MVDCSIRRPNQPHKMPGCRVAALFWVRPNHHEQRNGEQKGWEQQKLEFTCRSDNMVQGRALPAICHPTSSRTSRQTGHPGSPHLRSRCLTLSVAVHCHFKTSVFNARPVVTYFQIADSPVTPAVVSVHQGSVSSLTNELICYPEIRRVDVSVHHHHHQYAEFEQDAFSCLLFENDADGCDIAP